MDIFALESNKYVDCVWLPFPYNECEDRKLKKVKSYFAHFALKSKLSEQEKNKCSTELESN